eukprot:jgi/Psemu1/305746/fgenesh1_kg.216_\
MSKAKIACADCCQVQHGSYFLVRSCFSTPRDQLLLEGKQDQDQDRVWVATNHTGVRSEAISLV